MAILKVMCIREPKRGRTGEHLKNALEYIQNPEKCALVRGIYCRPEDAHKEMLSTKDSFMKTWGRQGYHLVISLPPEEDVRVEDLMEIAENFLEAISPSTEAVIAVHNNTDKLHAHIVFNSINFADGHKFHMKDGDMEAFLRKELDASLLKKGLSPVKRKDGDSSQVPGKKERYDVGLIRMDFDECRKEAADYPEFIRLLEKRGYTIKNAGLPDEEKCGKYLTVWHEGMERSRRCREGTLGDAYTREALKLYFEKKAAGEDEYFKPVKRMPEIVRCRVKRYKRAKLSPVQKRYIGKLYRAGVMKRRPYSVAWKYRGDIREFHKLQEEYLLIKKSEISSAGDLENYLQRVSVKEKKLRREKAAAVKEKKKMQPLLTALSEMQENEEGREMYLKGDKSFKEEYEKWEGAAHLMSESGYSVSLALKEKDSISHREAWAAAKLKNCRKEIKTAKEALRRLRLMEEEREREENRASETGEISKRERKDVGDR